MHPQICSQRLRLRAVAIWRCRRKYSQVRELAPAYKPALVETNRQDAVTTGCRTDGTLPAFNVLLPPPNVTGELHLGHALTAAIQDAMVRQAQLGGRRTVWIPGMDHAGIATQVIVEKRLQRERNLSRHDLGRERFLEEVHRWRHEKVDSIRQSMKRLGCAMNWEWEYFTMDERQSLAVREAFVRLFEAGLIYRQRSLVNWSCALESAISDIEVESLEIGGPVELEVPGYEKSVTFGQMADIAYRVQGTGEEIVVSTTRPETFLGDVAVAVNPNDGRYSHLRNSAIHLWHPVRKEEIPLIFDDSVDSDFGTGAVKITPAHDRYDYEMARKHFLPTVEVINGKGMVEENFGPFSGLPRYEARVKLLDYLTNLSLLRGIRPHPMVLPVCSRSKDVIEFLLRPQWFVRCETMAKRAADAVREGRLQITPQTFEKEWFRWLDDCRDWCISRQLWWGHRIPAYEVHRGTQASEWVAAGSIEEARQKVIDKFGPITDNVQITQDCDVLDTWFSSALLPFSATDSKHYPLDVMETGHDILFFWVARMVMLGQQLTGELPFRKILLHGIICDEYGRKMSKSLGNVIKPEHIIGGISLDDLQKETDAAFRQGLLSAAERTKSIAGQRKMFPAGIPECGIDALRFTLCSSNIKNHFISFNVQEAHTNKLFFNKIWQATRYTVSNRRRCGVADDAALQWEHRNDLTLMDRWILSRLGQTLQQCRDAFESHNFHLATAALKSFFYTNLCDVFLEFTKVAMKQERSLAARLHCLVLHVCLEKGLQQMAVFTPFLAHELGQHLPTVVGFEANRWIDHHLESQVDELLAICQNVRQAKTDAPTPIARKHNPVVHLLAKSDRLATLLERQRQAVQQLTLSSDVVLHANPDTFERCQFTVKSAASHDCMFGVVSDLGSTDSSSPVNAKKLTKLEGELAKLRQTVENDGYQKSANEKVKRKHHERLKQLEAQIADIAKSMV